MARLKRFLISATLLFFLFGCTASKETIDEAKEEVGGTAGQLKESIDTTINLMDSKDFSSLDPVDVSNMPSISEVTPKELYEYDVEKTKLYLAKNYRTNFRTHFRINEDRELTDNDWINLKAFAYYEAFGSFVYTDEAGEEHFLLDTSKEVQLMKEIFEAQMNETNSKMSDEEFIDYLYEKTYEQYCETEEDKAEYRKTLENMDKEKLHALKDKYLNEMEDD